VKQATLSAPDPARRLGPGARTGRDVVEPNEVDALAFAVFGDFEEIDHTQEPGRARQLRSDVRQPDGLDESISIWPSSIRYLLPTLTCRRV
jgi:hypothetical protein